LHPLPSCDGIEIKVIAKLVRTLHQILENDEILKHPSGNPNRICAVAISAEDAQSRERIRHRRDKQSSNSL
jgi:hypothetical protein